MSYRCLICDFDGTVADTFHQATRILNLLADEHGYRKVKPEEFEKMRSMTMSQFLKYMGIAKRKLPRLLLAGRSMLAEQANEILPIEGMAQTLHTLRPDILKIGILTSNSEHNVRTFMKSRDMEIFDFVSSVPKLSGKAKYLKAIMRTYSLQRDEVLYVGDETRDIKAARKAKVSCAAVTWGFNSKDILEEAEPNYILSRPEELLTLLIPEM